MSEQKLFLHHEDEELLVAVYGSPAAIPEALRAEYHRAIKLFHGVFGGQGALPIPCLLSLLMAHERPGTVTHTSESVAIGQLPEGDPPPVGPVHHPKLDWDVNTKVRIDGQLGYVVGPWGNEKLRVRIEGDEAPYRVFAINDVELAL